MSLNEIPVNELIRELSAKIGEVVTENIALKIQVAELSSVIASLVSAREAGPGEGIAPEHEHLL